MTLPEINPEELLTSKEVAKMLRMSYWHFCRMRSVKSGPPYLKLGKAILYNRADVIAWLEKTRVPA